MQKIPLSYRRQAPRYSAVLLPAAATTTTTTTT
jgi:hypothetical protein